MDLKRNQFTAQSGNQYSYIYNPPKDGSTTLLFLHGFPSTLNDWVKQIEYFSLEHGVVALDLLGYGESSKPTDALQYRLKPTSDEIVELLDHLGLSQVVGVGHDIGATLLSRLAAYHPTRWRGLVFLAVGPPKLGTPFNVGMINQMTKKALGFELLGYIPWLVDSAQEALEEHAEAAMSLIFCRDTKEWNEWFRPLGKMQQFVSEDRRVPIGSWYTETLQKQHLAAFGVKGGYSCTTWYRMWVDNLFAPDEVGLEEFKISQPVLLVVPNDDGPMQEQMLASWAPNLRTVSVDSGHWVHLERATETNNAIEEFLNTLATSN